MSVRVRVPTPLRKFTKGVDEVNAQGSNMKRSSKIWKKIIPASRNEFAMRPESPPFCQCLCQWR